MKVPFTVMALTLCWCFAAHAAESDKRYVISRDGVAIDVIDEGKGPLMVLLPSAGRDSEDYDKVAEGLATAGFRVLRPQPRGAGKSTGPTEGITLHDLAKDVALTIENAQDGQAIIVGHAFGNWVARMTAADHPELVRGVVIAAAASKDYPKDLLVSLRDAANVALPDQQRLAALRIAFFAPGNDPSIWLKGWHPKIAAYQRPIIASPKEQEWWSGGSAPLLDLAGPFSTTLYGKRHEGGVRRPRDHCHSGKCQPRSHPRAAGFGGRRNRRVGEDAKALATTPTALRRRSHRRKSSRRPNAIAP